MALKKTCLLLAVLLSVAILANTGIAADARYEPLPNAAVEHVCNHDNLSKRFGSSRLSSVAKLVKDPRRPRTFGDASANPSNGTPSMQVYQVQSTASGWKPIRIGVFSEDLNDNSRFCTKAGQTRSTFDSETATCTEDDVLTAKKKQILLEELIPRAIQLHEERLLVEPITQSIEVPQMGSDSVCYYFTIPSSHHTSGVSDLDFIVYLAAGPTTGNTIAWALSCAYLADGRPVVGAINVSPKFIKADESTVRVIAHEMLHALGFNYNMFEDRQMTTTLASLRGKSNVPIINSASVVERTREQYGCSTTAGMELEDQGGAGTALSHWKRRNALDEIMAGISGIGYYTALTIAAMEDTGYYKGNYTNAETMSWGKGVGCRLLDEKCVISGVSQESSMFYDRSVSRVCPSDRLGIGYVQIGEYTSDLPSYYQYFSDPTMGGSAQLVDYCPIAQSYSNTGCSTGDASVMPGSVLSASSRCFTATNLVVSKYQGPQAAICVNVKCNKTTKSYQVQVKGSSSLVDCPAGGQLRPSQYSNVFSSGTIDCPQYDEVCARGFSYFGDGAHSSRSVYTCGISLCTLLLFLLVVA